MQRSIYRNAHISMANGEMEVLVYSTMCIISFFTVYSPEKRLNEIEKTLA